MKTLRLFSPADRIDWSCEIQTERELQLIKDIASRNKMAIKVDEALGKVFLGRSPGPVETDKPREGTVLYPSGVFAKAAVTQTEASRYGVTGSYSAAPLIQAKAVDKLSEHFTAGEFFCHDTSYKYVRVSPELVAKLEKIRAAVGGPLTIHSAYRPPAYNLSIGGVSNSCHVDGLAADISAPGKTTAQLHEICLKVIGSQGGVGYYPTQQFVHVDVRGHESRWEG